MTETVPRIRRRWLRPLLALGLIALAWLGGFWYSSLSGKPAPLIPVPNGYDDIVRAGSSIQGQWPNKGDLVKAPVDEIRPFVAANHASLDLMRVGLGRECLVVMADTQEGLAAHLPNIQAIRQLSRLLIGEGLVYQADGRFSDASRSYRELLYLGRAVTRNGLEIDATVGWVLQLQAVSYLGKIEKELPQKELRDLIGDLDAIDRDTITLDAIEVRRERWVRGTYSPYMRGFMRLSGMEAKLLEQSTKVLQTSRDKVVKALRLLEIQLAITAFHRDRQQWPRSVSDLVPAYLVASPIDPSTKQPIEYPANEAGELTDDLSTIGRADGSVTPRP